MHTFMRHQRTPSRFWNTTFYFNDRDKSDSHLKIYPKKNETGKFVRLELTLKRPAIEKVPLEFPFTNVESIDFFEYFTFKKVDVQRLCNYFRKLGKSGRDRYWT